MLSGTGWLLEKRDFAGLHLACRLPIISKKKKWTARPRLSVMGYPYLER